MVCIPTQPLKSSYSVLIKNYYEYYEYRVGSLHFATITNMHNQCTVFKFQRHVNIKVTLWTLVIINDFVVTTYALSKSIWDSYSKSTLLAGISFVVRRFRSKLLKIITGAHSLLLLFKLLIDITRQQHCIITAHYVTACTYFITCIMDEY